MARARSIKPSLFKNELLGAADPLLTLLFVSLWTLADKSGRLEDRPLRIKAETFPYRDNIDINGYLTQLQRLGFVDRYTANGIAVIEVLNFRKHQSPHSTEKASELPAKPIDSGVTVKDSLTNESVYECGYINVLTPSSLTPSSLTPDTHTHTPSELIPQPPKSAPSARVTTAAAVCISIRSIGIADVNPSHPELLKLLDGGADIALFVEAAKASHAKGKGFVYTIGAVKGMLRDACQVSQDASKPGTGPPRETNYQRSCRENWELASGRTVEQQQEKEINPVIQKKALEAHDDNY